MDTILIEASLRTNVYDQVTNDGEFSEYDYYIWFNLVLISQTTAQSKISTSNWRRLPTSLYYFNERINSPIASNVSAFYFYSPGIVISVIDAGILASAELYHVMNQT